MIKIDLDDICYECMCPDLNCDYNEIVCCGGSLVDRDYTISCNKAATCRHRKTKGDEEDHEWWK